MGGYDLYGRYYPRLDDAINAEMAQCAEIDNRHNRLKTQQLEKQIQALQHQQSDKERIEMLEITIENLTQRIKQLEETK